MHSALAFGLLALAGLSAAQEQYSIDPTSVPKSTRDYWCKMEKAQCPLICLQQPGVKTQNLIKNDCSADDLTYSCVCDNNVSPNVTMYTQTLPYFICTQWGTQCVSACSDNTCADKCRADHPCGASDPYKGNATASSTSSSTASKTASSSSDATSIAPAFGEGSGSDSAASTIGATSGMAITFVGILAGFALL
ncbi:hypothetical protein P280DRAFT_474209 [Massarina eburnea CBS 473.64]|uniref:DUF7707 domain-containing protein n=1 Tax=Massarina eburnea CBS 473.64 TaxID=1395130 RepID=A0A6A6RLJ4_9PLEO|nr:hypothetical protein P280DRAFT_474209 [Massarina eburnea CBS 473.64]